MIELNHIYNLDCRAGFAMLPDNSVDMLITSPPYWAKRDYQTQSLIWGGDKNCEHEWTESEITWHSGTNAGEKQQSIRGAFHNNHKSSSGFCSKCGAWYGDLGMEQTPEHYVEHLLQIFDDIKRVLTPFGSVYVNIGDTYAANRSYQVDGTKQLGGSQPNLRQPQAKDTDINEKSLCCIPDMFKIGMVKRGWTCRSEIIWHKCNAMPSSASDRYTDDFEKVYFFVKSTDTLFWTNEKTLQLVQKQPKGKAEGVDWEWRPCPQCQREIPENGANIGDNNKEPYKKNNPHTMRLSSKAKVMKLFEVELKQQEPCTRCGGVGQIKVSLWSSHDYYFEQQFEPYTEPLNRWGGAALVANGKSDWDEGTGQETYRDRSLRPNPQGRNKRSVWFTKGALWSINTKGFKEAHFAVFNEELIETPILASCPEFVCTVCGMPKVKVFRSNLINEGARDGVIRDNDIRGRKSRCGEAINTMAGYAQCSCDTGFRRGILLDPFMGSGTTAIKARKMNRDYIGFELNSTYVGIAENRLAQKVLIDYFDTNQEPEV